MDTSTPYPHAVAALRAARKAKSTRPFLARGHQVKRCERCRIDKRYCICAWQPSVKSAVGMCLLMYDTEPMKPSNTGWLIADIVQETYAFNWTRVGDMQALKDLINDPLWQPYIVFPEDYAEPERVVKQPIVQAHKKPLFILLDATWPEARKMFRKSPYLNHLPVLSLSPQQCSRYQLRRSCQEQHLCTAEVATLCLDLVGEVNTAQALNLWLDIFVEHYLAAKEGRRIDDMDLLHQRIQQVKPLL